MKERLEDLAGRVERGGVRSLGGDEILELNRLFRRLTSDLARARREDPGGEEAAVLNARAARIHGVVYRARRTRASAVWRFFAETLPASIASHAAVILLCIGIFAIGTAFSFWFVAAHPGKAHHLVPPMIIENAEQGFREENFEKSTSAWQQKPAYVSFYITNNVKVAFVAFAVGVGFAVPTVIVLFQNGITMGATAAIVHEKGLLGNLAGFIAPHGPIELGAIFMSAAAGMLLGIALIRPGRRTRREALKAAARDVIVLVVGAACMLVVAALFETFVAPLPVPNWIKWAIGGVNATLLALYALHGRRIGRPGGGT